MDPARYFFIYPAEKRHKQSIALSWQEFISTVHGPVIVYGLGEPCRHVLREAGLGRLPHGISGFVDADPPNEPVFQGMKACRPSELKFRPAAVVVGSAHHEDEIVDAARSLYGEGVQIFLAHYDQERIPGVLGSEDILRFTDMVSHISGDFAEFGVWRGDRFYQHVIIAQRQNKHAHAFDTFRGMCKPGKLDSGAHPEGEFDVGGREEFVRLMEKRGISRESFSAWSGPIPECFGPVPENLQFSYGYIDLDNCEPTREALRWFWSRLNEGGILILDDFYLGGTSPVDSSWAIQEFLRECSDFLALDYLNYQLFLQKRLRMGATPV